MEPIRVMADNARKAARKLAATDINVRNGALLAIAKKLEENQQRVLEANAEDVKLAEKEGLSAPLLSRLKVTEAKLARMTEGLRSLVQLPDPLGHVQYARELTPGMQLYRVACPIGVIGVIFESRPDALVQISSLCLKSGNAVLLKGGREALQTNTVLAELICEATQEAGLPAGWCGLFQTREDVQQMLKLDDLIDLIIRGRYPIDEVDETE